MIYIFTLKHKKEDDVENAITYESGSIYSRDEYIHQNGLHFNDKLLTFAVNRLKKKNQDGTIVSVKPYSKLDVDEILSRNGVKLDKKKGLDYVYVANMAKADFLGSSIEDELHLAKYIKDVIDDYDAPDGCVFLRWETSTAGIQWNDFI